MVLVGWLVS